MAVGPPSPAQPKKQVAHYQILSELGRGGMGVVYRARDLTLKREVALKSPLPEHATERDCQRLLREARASASLSHPHIVPIFEVLEDDGRPWLAMELVEGRSLRAVLREGGALPVEDTLRHGEALAGALQAAHGRHILHRDVNPNNIMLTADGRVQLMDFGLAQVIVPSGDASSTTTRSSLDEGQGAVAGTPGYMSPEQLLGRPLDQRSDLFSLGAVLYEMCTGAPAFTGPTHAALIDTILNHEPPPVRRLNPAAPIELERLIHKALAKRTDERYQSASDLAVDLRTLRRQLESGRAPIASDAPPGPAAARARWAALAAAAIVAGAIAAPVWTRWSRPVARDSIAVLPFRNIGPSPEAEYFAEGISDDITAQVSKLPGILVVSGTSVRRFRDSEKSPAEIGRELGVATLLAGSVRLSREHVRVVVELLDCATSQQLTAETFDRPLKDVFAAQTEIALRIGVALKGQLSSQEVRSLERRPMNPRAFQLYLEGRYHWNKRTPEGLRRSVKLFKQAVLAEPNAALLQAGLADAYLLSGIYDLLPTDEAQRLAEETALRAVRLDANLPEAQATLGSVRQEQFRWNEAQAAFRRAIELNPNYAAAHHWYALLLASLGRFEDAHTHMQAALSVDPLSLTFIAALGFVNFLEGDLDEALQQYRRGLELESDQAWVHRQVAMAYEAQGAYADALTWLSKAESGSARRADLNAIRANVYALAGKRDEARRLLDDLERVAAREPIAGTEMALAYFALDESARGYAWLDRAIAARENDVQYLAVEPRFGFIRRHTRFQELLRQLGLPNEPGR